IEQTTSAVLPQLFLDKFSTEFDKQKAINNINAAIERYANFQTTKDNVEIANESAIISSTVSDIANNILEDVKKKRF
ncbi:hypothetical protein VWM78_09890, partial [Campylobacter coli]